MRENTVRRCCFTGHRPFKLGITEEEAKILLEAAADEAIKDGYTEFFSGMAEGIDVWAAEIIIKKKAEYPDIKLICVLPYASTGERRSYEKRIKFDSIIKNADEVVVISPKYTPYCFFERNKYMTDRSERLIAAFNGAAGGTKYTVDYALEKGLEVVNILDR